MRVLMPGCLLAVALVVSAYAADTVDPSSPRYAAPAIAGAPLGEKGRWVEISDKLLSSLEAAGNKIGYPGKVTGITVDPANGNVYMVVPDQGVFLSTDHAATFARADGKAISGRCETGGTLQVDPAGGRIACFMLDGTAGMTLDGGKTWSGFTGVGRGWDYASVDWSAEKPSIILAMRHESNGELYLTADAGKTWKKIAKDAKYNAVGVFDTKTFIACKSTGGIFRSTDTGATWAQVSDLTVTSHVPTIYKGTAYLISKDGLIASADQGITWTKRGAALDATFGPVFKDEKQMIVWGKKGIYESTDAGATWSLILTPPAEYGKSNPEWFNNVGWDSKADIFYVAHMGLPAYRWQR